MGPNSTGSPNRYRGMNRGRNRRGSRRGVSGRGRGGHIEFRDSPMATVPNEDIRGTTPLGNGWDIPRLGLEESGDLYSPGTPPGLGRTRSPSIGTPPLALRRPREPSIGTPPLALRRPREPSIGTPPLGLGIGRRSDDPPEYSEFFGSWALPPGLGMGTASTVDQPGPQTAECSSGQLNLVDTPMVGREEVPVTVPPTGFRQVLYRWRRERTGTFGMEKPCDLDLFRYPKKQFRTRLHLMFEMLVKAGHITEEQFNAEWKELFARYKKQLEDGIINKLEAQVIAELRFWEAHCKYD
jgi:hypothetical protein